MKFERESAAGNRIRSFENGRLHVNNEVLDCNIIISAEELVREWAPPAIAALSIADFEPILAMRPEVILFGTGADQAFPPARIMTDIMRRGVGFEVMSTDAACRTFNVLLSEQRRVVAALLIDR